MTKAVKSKAKLFVVSAPSGAGKTTLAQALIKQCGKAYNLERVITYTTRNPRIGEINGFDYHFISQNEFQEKISQEFFLEWSADYGHCYGCPKGIVDNLEKNKSQLVILDCKGACSVRSLNKQAVLIWIEPKNLENLHKRLLKRESNISESEAKIDVLNRLQLAKKEIELERIEAFFDYRIINENFDKALRDLELIIKKELS